MIVKKTWLRLMVKLVWYGYVIAGPAIPILFPAFISTRPFLTYILTPAWIALVSKLLYDNSDLVYFSVTKLFLWLTNANVDWSLSVEFDLSTDAKIIEIVFDKVLEAYKDAKPWHNDDLKKIIELPNIGCNIRFNNVIFGDGLNEETSSFYFEVSELIVPFRKSEEILEKIISLINGILLPTIRPSSEKYTFKLRFGDTNPYFGLFVRKLRLPDQSLVTFSVVFDESVGLQKERVEVSESRVALTTRSLPSLQILSKRYITLASFDMTNP